MQASPAAVGSIGSESALQEVAQRLRRCQGSPDGIRRPSGVIAGARAVQRASPVSSAALLDGGRCGLVLHRSRQKVFRGSRIRLG